MSDEPLIWVDGAPCDALPLPDRGLEFGDGLFETLLIRKGRAQWPELHLARLQKGLAVLGFPDCVARVQTDIDQMSQSLVDKGWPWVALRVTVTRGEGPRGYAPPVDAVPRIILTASKLERQCDDQLAGARLCEVDINLAQQPVLAGIKHLNRLEQVLAGAQARASGCDEALLCDDRQRVICVGSGNIFAVFNQEILTPSLDTSGIAGTRRFCVMQHWAPHLGFKLAEADLKISDLAEAEEVFYTNTLVGIRSVVALGELAWSEGEKTAALFQHYQSELY